MKKPMKVSQIKSVSFRANGPAKGMQFSHVHVEATAVVEPGQDPADVLDGLKSWTLAHLVLSQEDRQMITENVTLDAKISRVEHELEDLIRLRQARVIREARR